MSIELDRIDKLLLNRLQGGFPISPRPFQEVGDELGIAEKEVIARLKRLLEAGGLTRLGAILSPVGVGGDRTLAAMHVPAQDFDLVAEMVNRHPEVSHNYQREHYYNMWFVVSSENERDIQRVLSEIEAKTGIPVIPLPSLEEYFVEFRYQFPVD